ncbi:hypothetical protein DFH06DRAFT_1333887 [Mycena polygramma]|nr:hypothetical protein DFH06DRAFT_1333887 [Mycena polygramma]
MQVRCRLLHPEILCHQLFLSPTLPVYAAPDTLPSFRLLGTPPATDYPCSWRLAAFPAPRAPPRTALPSAQHSPLARTTQLAQRGEAWRTPARSECNFNASLGHTATTTWPDSVWGVQARHVDSAFLPFLQPVLRTHRWTWPQATLHCDYSLHVVIRRRLHRVPARRLRKRLRMCATPIHLTTGPTKTSLRLQHAYAARIISPTSCCIMHALPTDLRPPNQTRPSVFSHLLLLPLPHGGHHRVQLRHAASPRGVPLRSAPAMCTPPRRRVGAVMLDGKPSRAL